MHDTPLRHLGALRRAVASLNEYYHELREDQSQGSRDPKAPYPTSFSWNGSTRDFDICERRQGRATLFFGHLDGNPGFPICVKFANRYL